MSEQFTKRIYYIPNIILSKKTALRGIGNMYFSDLHMDIYSHSASPFKSLLHVFHFFLTF